MKTIKIDIPPKTIFITTALILGLILAWQVRLVIFLFFIAFIIASGLRPLVEMMAKKGVPRLTSIMLLYLLFFGLIALILFIAGRDIVVQVSELANNANVIIGDLIIRMIDAFPFLKDVFQIKETAEIYIIVEESITRITTNFVSQDQLGGAVVGALTNIFEFMVGVFTVISVSIYMLISEDKFYSGILSLVEEKRRDFINNVINKVEEKLGHWLIGQMILMLAVGFATYVLMMIPAIFFPGNLISEYAIPIALIAGLLEALPNLGPMLTWVVTLIITVGSGGGPVEAVYISVAFFGIQQAENALLVPMVMKKAVGIDPVVVILAIIAASTIFGIMGALLVIPLVAAAQIVIEEFIRPNQEKTAVNKMV